MKIEPARRTRRGLLALLLPALLIAACGSGSSPAPGATSSTNPSGASSGAPTGGMFQPSAFPDKTAPPAESGPLALDELGPGPGPAAPLAVKVQTGEPATVETPIGSAGGTITTPAGTRLVFPPGSLSDGAKVIVNERKVLDLAGASGAPLPIVVKPVSLIEVNLGGAEPTLPVAMTIPVTAGPDEVALAGHLDTATGVLEPLTLLASDATSITVAVTRFPAVLTFTVPLGPLPDVVDSGFRPGRDDWQFPNYGSSVEPEGFCAGATASELGYYNERRVSGGSPLFGLYDNDGGTKTTGFWEDDADGIKLATMVQSDFNRLWDGGSRALVNSTISASPASTFAAFRSWLALTRAPQLAYVRNAGSEAHAMIVYQVDATRLLVADPNKPGIERWIDFDSAADTFEPYMAGTKADGTPLAFDRVAFMVLDMMMPHDELAARWNEFDAGTIGDAAFTDEVPHLAGKAKDLSLEDLGALSPTMTVPSERDSVRLAYAEEQPSERRYSLVKDASRYYFDNFINLDMGENPLAVTLYRTTGDNFEWAGYERFAVVRGEATPSPTPNLAEPVQVTISADVPIGGAESTATCPAEVTLSFIPSSGDPTTMQGHAALWAHCTNVAFSALDAAGTFDGHTFTLRDGSATYSGTLEGGTATLTGGPRDATFVFPIGP